MEQALEKESFPSKKALTFYVYFPDATSPSFSPSFALCSGCPS